MITWISDKAEFTPKTIQTKDERANLVYAVKIHVKNDGLLKIGMYGEVKFKLKNMPSVLVENIVKTYGSKKAVVDALKGVSFSVDKGEIFGIIGPDGAGKTSLFRILTTLLLADSGKASVDGFDVVKDYKQIRNRVGYMPGKFSLYQDLTVQENLEFFATIFGYYYRRKL